MQPRRKIDSRPQFLSGWKEISNYLGKGVRTVQRYERTMGFPVRRPGGKNRAAVIATKAEVDAWVAASSVRDAFYLSKPAPDASNTTASITSGLAEMARLRHQLSELRLDVVSSVYALSGSIQGLREEIKNRSNSARPAGALLGTGSGYELSQILSSYLGSKKDS